MSLNPSWAPTNATAADLWGQRSQLAGLFIASVGYGVHLTLFFLCFNILYSQRKKTRKDWMMLAYISILFIFGTIGNATNTRFAEMLFIDDINYPGGPNAFNVDEATTPVLVVCNSVYIVNLWFQDGLLLYRFFIMYGRNIYAMIIPTAIYITDIVLSCLVIAQLSLPNDTLWSQVTSHLAITFWSLSVCFNVILTAAISIRLLLIRHRTRKSLPGADTPYLSISAMLVESAFLYTCNAIIFLVSFGLNSNVQNLVVGLLGQTQSIAPLMIILRVAQGNAWSDETFARSPLQFRSPSVGPDSGYTGSTTTTFLAASNPSLKKPSINFSSMSHEGRSVESDGPSWERCRTIMPHNESNDARML